ncbi:hypothetical protein Bca101_052570 [Brassica carinata]
MGKSDENSVGLIGSTNLQGGRGKIMPAANTGPTRRALSAINKNINEPPSYPYAVTTRDHFLSKCGRQHSGTDA